MAPTFTFDAPGCALLEDGSSDDLAGPMREVWQHPAGDDGRCKAITGRPGILAGTLVGAALLGVAAVRAVALAPALSSGAARSSIGLSEHMIECGPPEKGDSCYRDIQYAHDHIKKHPEWYVGLHPDSTFKQVQAFLHKQKGHEGKPRCPMPCGHIQKEDDDGHKALHQGKCHTALPGEDCYNHIIYTQKENLPKHPEWYPGLAQDAGFKVVQDYLHLQKVCPTPCGLEEAKKKDAKKHHSSKDEEMERMAAKDHCHTAKAGEGCYGDILWAKDHIRRHAEWYKGLSVDSTFDEIQAFLSRQHNSDPTKLCPKPCNDTANEILDQVNVGSSCHTANKGTGCYKSVLWVIAKGIDEKPKWYKNISRKSKFEDVQELLVKSKDEHCHRDPCACEPAKAGTKCRKAIDWVQNTGLKKHPDWYKGLTSASTREEIQTRLHQDKHPFCLLPCQHSPWLRYQDDGTVVTIPIDADGNPAPYWGR